MRSEDKGVQLYPEVIEAIRQFINSDAWERFYKPALENMKSEWMKTLMDPDEDRKKKYPDDYIRGCFETIDVFLRLPEALINEQDAEIERQHREREETGDLQSRASSGYIGPLPVADHLRER